MKQLTTLSIVRKDDMVLLAMKKRGSGEGLWNGYGGKVEEGEEIEDAMIRELEEESGVKATQYEKRAIINFISQGSDKEVEMHVYEIFDYEGEVVETEEMSPKWFKISEIPYDKMWASDKEWMELFFQGGFITGEAIFNNETNELISCDYKVSVLGEERIIIN